MVFVPAFRKDEQPEITHVTNGREHVVTAPLGFDSPSITYSCMAALSPYAGSQSGEFELIFCVIEYDHEEECNYQLWDGRETRYKISNPLDRKMCMGLFCALVQVLIDVAHPISVVMYAYSPGLPQKALAKYDLIVGLFSQAGFTVEKLEPVYDRRGWLMERASDWDVAILATGH